MKKKNNRSPEKPAIADNVELIQETNDINGLRESEAKYRGFIENLAVMFYAAEPRPPYSPIYISPAFEQFGYPLEEWRGSLDLWTRILHADDRDWVLKESEAAMRAGEETDFEYRIVAQNGAVHWVRDRGSFIRDEQGNAICWQGIILDITNRKLDEQKLQRSEKLYRTLAHSIPQTAVVLFDRDFRYTLADGVLLEKHGFSREMFEGKTLWEVFPPGICEEWSDYYRRALGGETVSLEQESEEGCFQIYVVPVRNECKEIFAGMVMWQDISERKQSEEALRESEGRYRQMFEKNQAIKLLIDADTGAIVDTNPAACNFYGYTSAEFKTKNITDLNTLPAKQVVREMKRAKTERRNYFLFRHRLASGKVRDVEVHSSPLQDQNRNLLYSIIKDVTERKQTEAALKKSEERYRDLFENANDLIYIHDLEGNFISVNRAAERVFGYTREEALRMNIKQIIAPEHLKLAGQNLSAKIAGIKQAVYEVDCITKDERKIRVEINSRAIYEEGVPVAVQGIARDVTERKRIEKEVQRSEAELNALFAAMTDVIMVTDGDGRFLKIAPVNLPLLFKSADEIIGKTLHEVFSNEQANFFLSNIRRALTERQPVPMEYKLDFNGKSRWFTAITSPMLKNAALTVARDITERKQAEENLKASEEQYRELFENANDLIYTHDLQGNFTSLNRAGEIVTGFSRDEAMKMNIAQVVAPDYLEAARQMIHQKVAGESPTTYEIEIIAKKGHRVSLELSTRLIYQNNQPVGVQGIARDITERKQTEQQLLYNALHDGLTNLPNRAKFMGHLEHAANRAERNPAACFAVLFLDLDRFKLINDSLGHFIGDKLLIAIAQRLVSCVRPSDIVARLGGDEFTILLNHITEPADAVRVANRFLERLSEPFKVDTYEVFTSASIGIIVSDEIQRQPEDFLRDADTAMYRAKEAGKSRYEIFDREMHIRNMNLLEMENDLRQAIENNEFRVFYQPIVSLETGEIREFEALIRWQHPKYGLIMPNEFINIAEETGLIVSIGEWILREACRQTAEWKKTISSSAPLSVSVNLSAKQLMHPNLSGQVEKILTQSALSPRCLKLEVTETMVMENCDKAVAVISNLHRLGVSLSTDDFGTGYSSLSYLHRFPFNSLKIDRSFVSKMDSDRKSEAIVRTILLLGQNLNMETVAEGVENERQLESLCRLGCKIGQGYLFSKPVNAETAEQLLREGLPNAFDKSLFNLSGIGGQQMLELEKVQ